MPDTEFYSKEIEKLKTWQKLSSFWKDIQQDKINDKIWPAGKAFEFFILRCFEMDDAEVSYPFSVNILGEPVEQIDGAVYYKNLSCIIESKDYNSSINITPIAKLRNQLLRRPGPTIGCIFVKDDFSPAAITLTKFMFPQTILLWNGAEIEHAINKKSFCKYLYLKYKGATEYGITDLNITEY